MKSLANGSFSVRWSIDRKRVQLLSSWNLSSARCTSPSSNGRRLFEEGGLFKKGSVL